jgi:hypothetical protein
MLLTRLEVRSQLKLLECRSSFAGALTFAMY